MKTIDLTVKTWRDRVNGNNYVAGRIVTDYGTDEAKTLAMPFHYGDYGQAEFDATNILAMAGMIEDCYAGHLSTYCREHNIIYRYNHTEGCLMRDVKAFGKA